jgi:hypothetical protein
VWTRRTSRTRDLCLPAGGCAEPSDRSEPRTIPPQVVKLIDVYMVDRTGKKAGHHWTTKEILKALDDRLSPGWASQKEEPTRIPAYDEMEPDIANIRGQEGRSNA